MLTRLQPRKSITTLQIDLCKSKSSDWNPCKSLQPRKSICANRLNWSSCTCWIENRFVQIGGNPPEGKFGYFPQKIPRRNLKISGVCMLDFYLKLHFVFKFL